jgi:hypothetical protein
LAPSIQRGPSVVKGSALADLLLVGGNPLEDVEAVGKIESLRVII